MTNNETLEVKIAFLEETVTALNKEYFIQQKEIEELKEQMNLLVVKLQTLQNNEQHPAEVEDEKPPHY